MDWDYLFCRSFTCDINTLHADFTSKINFESWLMFYPKGNSSLNIEFIVFDLFIFNRTIKRNKLGKISIIQRNNCRLTMPPASATQAPTHLAAWVLGGLCASISWTSASLAPSFPANSNTKMHCYYNLKWKKLNNNTPSKKKNDLILIGVPNKISPPQFIITGLSFSICSADRPHCKVQLWIN